MKFLIVQRHYTPQSFEVQEDETYDRPDATQGVTQRHIM